MSKIAVIRVRGSVNLKKEVKDTLELLRLYRKNYCIVVDDTPSYKGMITKVKDYVTFGEIDDETFKELIEKRGEAYKGREKDRKGRISYK
ncbi:uL30 family ribosomal protein, partial [Candidatus Woesearchaeota archaeon]|nr:uL30 family ribosomal protein [Candidatus Woesearchaeota archaeon]